MVEHTTLGSGEKASEEGGSSNTEDSILNIEMFAQFHVTSRLYVKSIIANLVCFCC